MIRVFSLDIKYPLDAVVKDMLDAKELIKTYREDHPDIDVYWHPVHKA